MLFIKLDIQIRGGMQNIDVSNIGLVLEGGGMRGVFTCGVIDYFLEREIEFPYAVGVSAGAGNGLSYISKQKGRAKKVNIDLYEKYNYIGFKHFVRKRNIFDLDFLYNEVPEKILPYDYDAYFASAQRFEMVTTNCLTGEANYLEEKQDKSRLLNIALASGSLPIMCPIAYVDDIPMLDGGVVDSIPVVRAQSQGYEKNVVVLTRNRGYRKNSRDFKLPSFVYRKYPEMRHALEQRGKLYNDQLALVEQLEDEGKIFVIRPEKPVEVDRLEKDISKLVALYEEGYEMGQRINEMSI